MPAFGKLAEEADEVLSDRCRGSDPWAPPDKVGKNLAKPGWSEGRNPGLGGLAVQPGVGSGAEPRSLRSSRRKHAAREIDDHGTSRGALCRPGRGRGRAPL